MYPQFPTNKRHLMLGCYFLTECMYPQFEQLAFNYNGQLLFPYRMYVSTIYNSGSYLYLQYVKEQKN